MARSFTDTLAPYGFSIEAMNLKKTELQAENLEKSILYYNTIDSDDASLQALKEFLDIDMVQKGAPVYSQSGTTIEIILA